MLQCSVIFVYLENWIFRLCPSSSILKITFWKVDLFPFSGVKVECNYSVGSVRKN
jgi:hypothetical protein